MNKDQKKKLLEELADLYQVASQVHIHASTINGVNKYMMEPIVNGIHNLQLQIEKTSIEEPSKDGLYWARIAKSLSNNSYYEYQLVLVTGDRVQAIIPAECDQSIDKSPWTDYKPVTITDPTGKAWIPSL